MKAWIDREYQYVQIPDFLTENSCKLIRFAHRVTVADAVFKLFDTPTNFTVYLFAPTGNDEKLVETSQKSSNTSTLKTDFNKRTTKEGYQFRGDGAFLKQLHGVNFNIDDSLNKNTWFNQWTLVGKNKTEIGFSRTATDIIFHDEIDEIMHFRYREGVHCNKNDYNFCNCLLKITDKTDMHYPRRWVIYNHKQTPKFSKIYTNLENGKTRVSCQADYLIQNNIFKKEFFNVDKVIIATGEYMWSGGMAYCLN